MNKITYNGDKKSAQLLSDVEYINNLIEDNNFVEIICLLRLVGMNDVTLPRLINLCFQLESYRGQIGNWSCFVINVYEFISQTIDDTTAYRYLHDLVNTDGRIIP